MSSNREEEEANQASASFVLPHPTPFLARVLASTPVLDPLAPRRGADSTYLIPTLSANFRPVPPPRRNRPPPSYESLCGPPPAFEVLYPEPPRFKFIFEHSQRRRERFRQACKIVVSI